MSGKVIDIDPRKQLSKEAFDIFKDLVADLKYDEVDNLTLILTPKSKVTSVMAYGVDFSTVGAALTIFNGFGQRLLEDTYQAYEANI